MAKPRSGSCRCSMGMTISSFGDFVHKSEIRMLVLHARYTNHLSYYDDWLDAFTSAPEFAVSSINICSPGARKKLKKEAQQVDLIVLLHSTNADTLNYLRPLEPLLADRNSKLLVFMGNELNLPVSPMAPRLAMLGRLEPDFIATQLLQEAGEWLYSDLKTSKILAIPHALNPTAFCPVKPHQERSIDFGTRSHKYLGILGDNDRMRLFELFSTYRFKVPMVIDISTSERFNREEWAQFLNNCKGTISNEAGSYYVERDDQTLTAVRHYLAEREKRERGVLTTLDSKSLLRRTFRMLPTSVRSVLRPLVIRLAARDESLFEESEFADIYEQFFSQAVMPPVYTKCISSRHFDAIGTKTCQIMIRGRFNGILEADRHYLALDSDFSNIGDVMERFTDPGYRQRLVDETYEYALSAHTYTHRMKAVAALLG